jgi:hypothetical protein
MAIIFRRLVNAELGGALAEVVDQSDEQLLLLKGR